MTGTVLAGVRLGEDVVVADLALVGTPPRGRAEGELPTVVGDGCVLRSGSVVYAGATLGARVQLGHGAVVREGNVVGDDSSVGTYSVLEGGCTIGRRSRIHTHCFLESVTVGDDVFIGPRVVFTDDPHPPCPKYVECGQGVTVEDRAKIGGGAVLLPGVTVGAGALVGAGAVVVGDVAPGAVVVGNPARQVKTVDELVCFAGLYDRVFEWEQA